MKTALTKEIIISRIQSLAVDLFNFAIQFIENYNNENNELKAQNKVLIEALEKIKEFKTLDNGEKYNSYVDGWIGVAEFAKKTIEQVKKMRGE